MRTDKLPQRFYFPKEIEAAHLRFVALMAELPGLIRNAKAAKGTARECEAAGKAKATFTEMDEITAQLATYFRARANDWDRRRAELAGLAKPQGA